MPEVARLLIVEDSEDDALLIENHLRRAEFAYESMRVDTLGAFEHLLANREWDVILCDANLPEVEPFDVIRIAQVKEPEVPVIVLSGSISLESMIELMRAGARDAIRKDLLTRLVPAIMREIKENEVRTAGRSYKSQLHTMVENISDGVVMFDKDGRMILCNQKYGDMYGLPVDIRQPGTEMELVMENAILDGKHLWPDPQNSIRMRAAWRKNPTPVTAIHELTDGRTIEITRMPLPEGGWVSTHNDITALKRAEAEIIQHRDHLQELVDGATVQLREKAKELRRALEKEKEFSRMQSEFVSMASHEFRTPLTIIDFTAQRVCRRASADRLTNPEVVRWMDKIMSATRRMTQLMESVLSAARLDSGNLTIHPQPCDLKELLETVVSRQQEISEQVRFISQISDLPGTVEADANAMDQALTNLLSNAVKYSPNGGDIEINAFPSGDSVVIQIKDHGVGIDEEDMPRLFERYFRAKTSTGIPGTGIGLCLVKAIVERHAGGLAVESRKGEGSVFTVTLPVNVATGLYGHRADQNHKAA
jgi:signal transduction histidine kinase/FixJ family two-component response regulator